MRLFHRHSFIDFGPTIHQRLIDTMYGLFVPRAGYGAPYDFRQTQCMCGQRKIHMQAPGVDCYVTEWVTGPLDFHNPPTWRKES